MFTKVIQHSWFLPYLQSRIEIVIQLNWNNNNVAIPLPLSNGNSVGEGSVQFLLNIFGLEGTISLFDACLFEKNILFVGHNATASKICECSFALVDLVQPAVDAAYLLQKRVFPHTSISDLLFADIPGFIAGTSNPVLETKCAWDILANVNTGQITDTNPNLPGYIKSSTKSIRQIAFKKKPHKLFSQRLLSGISLQLNEKWFRTQFQEYTLWMVDMALGICDVDRPIYELHYENSKNLKATRWFNYQFGGSQVDADAHLFNSHYLIEIYAHLRKLKEAIKLPNPRQDTLEFLMAQLLAFNNSEIHKNCLVAGIIKYFGSLNFDEIVSRIRVEPLRTHCLEFINALKLQFQKLLATVIIPI
eukprot:TRINITY_DN727_c1_g2_i2.p1 TRINITY_DN727_c1_g2~~TRINITY_DN727_c1_g2_i2.p1  ORF type:complete len:361 (-),score=142.06 TRINITY_DN727_c1_g2_i2:18-1100(-)